VRSLGHLHAVSNPALRFVTLLLGALACGHAHVAGRMGDIPDEPTMWGWQRKPTGQRWLPLGMRLVGSCEATYSLEPNSSYQAQTLAGAGRLAVSEQSLRHRLRQSGKKQRELIEKFQPASDRPDEYWTDDMSRRIEWFLAGIVKRLYSRRWTVRVIRGEVIWIQHAPHCESWT
jgi:hypothetical protein